MYQSIIAKNRTCSACPGPTAPESRRNGSASIGDNTFGIEISKCRAASAGERYPEVAGTIACVAVSARYAVDIKSLKSNTRGKAEISRARQIAMYLMHTTLSCSYQEVAAYFRRDRTTIAHACALIEDERDQPEFEKEISNLEHLLELAQFMICVQGAGDIR